MMHCCEVLKTVHIFIDICIYLLWSISTLLYWFLLPMIFMYSLCTIICSSKCLILISLSIYFRLLPRSTATLTFPPSSQACGDTFKTPMRERSSNRRVQPTLRLRRLTLEWPTRGNKSLILCDHSPVFTQCNHACKNSKL